MSAPRLTFLYPHLFRSARSRELCTRQKRLLEQRKPHRPRLIHNSRRLCEQSTYTQRYGPAAEPLPPGDQKGDHIDKSLPAPPASSTETQQKKPAIGSLSEEDTRAKAAEPVENEKPTLEEDETGVLSTTNDPKLAADEGHPSQPVDNSGLENTQEPVPEQLEKVLHMEAPTGSKGEDAPGAPHMQANPYVHHFDTYSLVKDLGAGSFTEKQAVTIMKSIRGMLAENLDMAKQGLVSKSDVENETYLFRAACSELRTEIINSRRQAAEKMRSERAHLHHESDILSQRITQETSALKDDLKGMFDDRKMATRMEQRGMESKIQEMNYKITVDLVGSSKGEVEGLRWFLTRRAALFIGSMALVTLGYLRYSTYVAHQEQEERKRANTSTSFVTDARRDGAMAQDTDVVLANMNNEKTDGVTYVSLG